MKKLFLLTFLIALSLKGMSQENMFTLGGGYSFANIQDTETQGTGWRINGTYEFNQAGGIFAHGITVSYIQLKATDGIGNQTIENKIHSVPFCYTPKLLLGKDKVKGFIKGAIGLQFAGIKREGLIEVTDSDMGFYGGAGAGIMLFLKENIFINAEYEIAWVSNSSFSDGWLNTVGGGIGFKF
jgi:hypothetical protein